MALSIHNSELRIRIFWAHRVLQKENPNYGKSFTEFFVTVRKGVEIKTQGNCLLINSQNIFQLQ